MQTPSSPSHVLPLASKDSRSILQREPGVTGGGISVSSLVIHKAVALLTVQGPQSGCATVINGVSFANLDRVNHYKACHSLPPTEGKALSPGLIFRTNKLKCIMAQF